MRKVQLRALIVVPMLMVFLTIPGCVREQVIIDWVDFVKVKGVMYLAVHSEQVEKGHSIKAGDLGSEYEKVRFRLYDNVTDPDYKAKDGDAAFLEVGTPLYRVKGYDPAVRLAAYYENRLVIYEAQRGTRE